LKRTVAIGSTPVVLAEQVDWIAPAALQDDRAQLVKAIEQWRGDWSALDTEAYLEHYAADFRTDDGMDKDTFSDYKRRVNAGKQRVQIGIGDLSLFAYPGESGLVVAQFLQNYVSDNFASSSRKDQYWRRQPDGQWRIVREMNR
ncbi:MAG: L,D-transpeptidase Cds6 family protein, partial [Nevskia sp.]|uniref:L,D-transpeptidase Cds6 family protein n=1 Tax=Nevskia sp. TaxID=1929292 RepID=UPI0040372DD2